MAVTQKIQQINYLHLAYSSKLISTIGYILKFKLNNIANAISLRIPLVRPICLFFMLKDEWAELCDGNSCFCLHLCFNNLRLNLSTQIKIVILSTMVWSSLYGEPSNIINNIFQYDRYISSNVLTDGRPKTFMKCVI